jgi:signal transduction histidine kinase
LGLIDGHLERPYSQFCQVKILIMNDPTLPRHHINQPTIPQFAASIGSYVPPSIAQKNETQFSSVLVHEVRNPLSNINLAAEMLQTTMIDDDQKIYLDIIMRGSRRINDIVTDLLTARETDQMQPEKHAIHKLLDEVLATIQDRILLKNIIVRKDYATVDCKILGNKRKLKIALTNIALNAIEAMPSEHGKLKLITKSVSGKCVIIIEDNGVGIDKENMRNIFNPYFTNKPGGLGLGLSTSLEILQSIHAGVEVQSEEGKGSRFILSFGKEL